MARRNCNAICNYIEDFSFYYGVLGVGLIVCFCIYLHIYMHTRLYYLIYIL